MFQRAYNLCIIYNLLLITWVSAESAMVGDDDPYVTNFCNYKCDLRKNICCLYSTTKFGDDCGDSAVVMDLSDDEIEIMVSKLNELRNQIAAGKSVRSDIRGITAADMHALSYSRELAYSASCWAMQCKLAHSRCKASKDGVLGETICWQSTLKEKNATAEVARQVLTKCPAVQMQNHPQLTTKVIDQLTFTSVGDDEKNRETIQLMWAKTEYIGCSRLEISENSLYFAEVRRLASASITTPGIRFTRIFVGMYDLLMKITGNTVFMLLDLLLISL
ncbi:Cysteine-rich secretory protein family [Popillia japonica]|uniref:Cysteine-rich secretory protein family n=1 Tax=Popillia japonica TaxID=7064 RepID=A0AAW1KPV4_POPJA